MQLNFKVQGRSFLPIRSRGSECEVSSWRLARYSSEELLTRKDDTALMLRKRKLPDGRVEDGSPRGRER